MDILLVDDHSATREEFVTLIEAHDDLTVVGQASNGEDGVRLARELRPDLILMDVVMPGMTGIDATKAIRASLPKVRVLAISNHTGPHLVDALLRSGASGYLRKDRAYEELIPAIRTIAGGTPYIGEHDDG